MELRIKLQKYSLWSVYFEGKTADKLGYDEMLGLVASITMPVSRPCLQWLKTKKQEKAYKDYLKNLSKKKK